MLRHADEHQLVSRERLAGAARMRSLGSEPVYCTLYRRTPGFVALAEAELGTLAGGLAAEEGVWLSSGPIPWGQTGYATGGGRQLAAARDLDSLRDQLLARNIVAPRIRIEERRIPRRIKGVHAAKVVIANCIDGGMDYDDPQLRLILVISDNGYRVLVEEDGGDRDWLGSAHKPYNFAVALPVRMAKAALNLTVCAGDTVLDPFCGSGTLVLLAAWAGHTAFGSDISAKGLTRAARNIAHFGQSVTLTVAKAQATDQRADCIVANLPYGLYCHLGPGALDDVLANLRRLAPRVTLISSGRLDEPLRAHGYVLSRVLKAGTPRFERYIHVTRIADV